MKHELKQQNKDKEEDHLEIFVSSIFNNVEISNDNIDQNSGENEDSEEEEDGEEEDNPNQDSENSSRFHQCSLIDSFEYGKNIIKTADIAQARKQKSNRINHHVKFHKFIFENATDSKHNILEEINDMKV